MTMTGPRRFPGSNCSTGMIMKFPRASLYGIGVAGLIWICVGSLVFAQTAPNAPPVAPNPGPPVPPNPAPPVPPNPGPPVGPNPAPPVPANPAPPGNPTQA